MREMKDSGIEWIGQIPKDWSLKKGRYLFVQRNDRGNDENLQLLSPSQKFGVIPQSLLEDLTTQTAVKLKENTDLSTLKTVHKGDFCISLRSFQGGFEYSEYEGVVSPAYQIFYKKEDLVNTYYKYIFKDSSFISKMNSYTMSLRDGKNISYFDFGNTYLPLPTVCEQQQIADFLDTKCFEIDATAEDIQKEISLLEDYKKSVITEAVTKGLNPDAEMKDSGIEWIGEIPKDWTVKNLKYIFDITSGSTPASGVSQYWDGDIKWITPADFKTNDVYVFGGRRNITGLGLMSCSTQVIPDSSIIFSKRAPIGSVVITGEKMCINQGCLALISKHQKTSVKFYYYALSILDKIFDMLGNGTTFKEISAFRFSNTSLQCPRFEEQQQIADYLDTKCSEIDTLIADKKRQLDILADYKKSLIYEYVTGKKEVPVKDF